MPDAATRRDIIQTISEEMSGRDESLRIPCSAVVARKTPGYVGSDLALLMANMVRMARDGKEVRHVLMLQNEG